MKMDLIKLKKLLLSRANCDPGAASGKGRSAKSGKERKLLLEKKKRTMERVRRRKSEL